MSKRKKAPKSESEFADALRAWERENPEAAKPDAASADRKAGAGEFNDGLAAALKERGYEAESKRATKRRAARAPQTESGVAPQKSASESRGGSESQQGRREMTSQELMREAFEAIGGSDYDSASKYLGEGYAAARDVELTDERSTIVDLPATADGSADEPTNDDLLFLEEMQRADVDRFNQQVERLRTRMPDSGLQWHNVEELTERSAEELMEPQLTAEQRDCLKRARRAGATPTINVRMLRRAEAIGELESFVLRSRQEGTRFVRIITGKGKQSELGVPVLKPAVIDWTERGRGASYCRMWAPETDRSGNYGAIILELKPAR